MRTRITTLLLALHVVAAPAFAQQLFDFLGQAVVPGSVGGMLNMESVINDPAPGTTPLPLDFANFQYTLVITGLELVAINGSTQNYANGTIAIYEDDLTPADYANPATFSDGTAILIGTVTSLDRTMFTATLGSAAGMVDWNGGTNIDDIAPEDQLGWPILTGISRQAHHIEPGYDEQWDGKVEPIEPIVDARQSTWSEVKERMR
jgi:hypothetical protein